MNTITCLLLIVPLSAGWNLALAEDQGEAPPLPFLGSPAAQKALSLYNSAKENATKAYDQAVDSARKQYLDALKREKTTETKKNNAGRVAELDNAIQQLEADAAAYKKKLEDAKLAAATLKEISINIAPNMKMAFILLPAGTFTMGSNKTVPGTWNCGTPHIVTFTKPFYMGKYKVTQEQWQAVMSNNPSTFKDPRNPVETVDWATCQDFVGKINQKLTGMKVSLPTEAQWEYACRACSKSEYCFGDDESKFGEYGWYKENSGGHTHPVGEKKPNAWGLYDTHGNTGDWCLDWYGPYGSSSVDPTGPASGDKRLTRGGSWFDIPFLGCSAYRGPAAPEYKNCSLGCRLVMTLDEGKK
jgi:formylglycine-generating enzyme required for sulfatase activity